MHPDSHAQPEDPESKPTSQYVVDAGLGNIQVFGRAKTMGYAEQIVEDAQKHKANGDYGVAVILAVMASEFSANTALSQAFKAREIEDLEEPIRRFFNGFSLNQEKNRKLLEALTGRRLTSSDWWNDYTHATEKRNKLLHRGERASEEDAAKAIAGATGLVKALGQWSDWSEWR